MDASDRSPTSRTSSSTRRSGEACARRVIDSRRTAAGVGLGHLMTLLFENRDTVLFQIQEMVRAERIVAAGEDPGRDRHLQRADAGRRASSSATLFIEITDPARVQEVLDGFIGLDEPGRLRCRSARRRTRRSSRPARAARTGSRRCTTFAFPRARTGARPWPPVGQAALQVDHGGYRARQVLSKGTVEELIEDLATA